MKKFFTLSFCLLATIVATAQTNGRNLFHEADIDEDGWLWFDSAEKIEKYIGVINETDYLVDPEGKPIQLVYADIFPDYPASEAYEDVDGAGIDGEIGSEGSRTGAIVLQPSSGAGNVNGGGFVVCMPSCYSYSICYSCNSRVMTRLVATSNANAPMSNSLGECELNSDKGWRVISAAYASLFKRLPSGIGTWDGLEKLSNGYEPVVMLQSNKAIYIWFQNATPDDVYIHGIKAITQETGAAGIGNVDSEGNGLQEIYTIDGRKVDSDLAKSSKGVYIITEQGKTRKVVK